MEARGKDLWLDVDGIRDAEMFPQALRRATESSDAFVFVFVISPDSVRSPFCEHEVAHAVALNKRIVPVALRAVAYDAIPEEVRFRNWIPAGDGDGRLDRPARAPRAGAAPDARHAPRHADDRGGVHPGRLADRVRRRRRDGRPDQRGDWAVDPALGETAATSRIALWDDGRVVATASEDGTVRVWLGTGPELGEASAPAVEQVEPDSGGFVTLAPRGRRPGVAVQRWLRDGRPGGPPLVVSSSSDDDAEEPQPLVAARVRPRVPPDRTPAERRTFGVN